MTRRQVTRIFDIRGREKGRSALTVRIVYKHCRPDLLVNMYYRPATMRLKDKILSTIQVAPPSPPSPTPAPGDDTPGRVTDYEMRQITPFVTHISGVHNTF